MNQAVWKYQLPHFANRVVVPKGAEMLSADWQGETLCVWALVDTEQAETESIMLMVVTTGGPVMAFPTPMLYRNRFIGTAQRDGYVVHVFDCGSTP